MTKPETVAADWLSRRPFSLLPPALRRTGRPATTIVTAYLFAFIGSILLSLAVEGGLSLLPGPTPVRETPEFGSGWIVPFGLVVFAPVVETLIMGTVLSGLVRIVSPAIAVAVSAIGWGIAHSLMVPTWGLVIWWPFLIFSLLFLVWRPLGWEKAAMLVTAVHALQNLIPALFILFNEG